MKKTIELKCSKSYIRYIKGDRDRARVETAADIGIKITNALKGHKLATITWEESTIPDNANFRDMFTIEARVVPLGWETW